MAEPGAQDTSPNLGIISEEQRFLDYDARRVQHQTSRDAIRATGKPEMWPVRTGIYKNGIGSEQSESITVNGIELTGMEPIIYKQVMDVLSEKEKDNINTPVVVLDLGGMYGISLIRLAKATEELVKQGRVTYVVSNLTFNPGTMSEDEIKSEATGLGHPDYNDFFLQNRGLVHFIMSDADELKNVQVALPTGVNLPLFGNIDVIHEQTALGKSKLPDFDLPTLGKSLSPYGIFFLGDKDAQFAVNPKAFELGERNLLQSGVNELHLGESARYKVFIKPKAPQSLAA